MTGEQVLRVPNADLDGVESAMVEAPHGWRGGEAIADPFPPLCREAVEVEVTTKR